MCVCVISGGEYLKEKTLSMPENRNMFLMPFRRYSLNISVSQKLNHSVKTVSDHDTSNT